MKVSFGSNLQLKRQQLFKVNLMTYKKIQDAEEERARTQRELEEYKKITK
jgi:hypothetical protein